jgi:hypothetical protein
MDSLDTAMVYPGIAPHPPLWQWKTQRRFHVEIITHVLSLPAIELFVGGMVALIHGMVWAS